MMNNIKAIMIGALLLGIVAAASWFYHIGGKSEQLKDVTTENAELATALTKQHELEEHIRQQEAEFAGAVAMIDAKYQKELSDAKKRGDGFIDDVMSGHIRLWDRHAHCGQPTTTTGATQSGSSVGDGAEGAELSEQVERFLELEAGRADEIVIQLTACQAILSSDRVVNQRRSDGQH